VNAHYTDVARRAGHRCEYCRAPEGAFNFAFEVEHVVPTSRGGSDESSNLALACRACNVRKGNVTAASDQATGAEAPLFNPRTNRWDDHFQIDLDSGEIGGRTPVGRVTVVQLDMNHPFQLAARQVWMQFRLFP
jgi:hypothetical protein